MAYVSQYVPGIRVLLGVGTKGTAVPSLLAAVADSPIWWSAQIAKAEKMQQQELRVCASLLHSQRQCPVASSEGERAEPSSSAVERPFTCDICSASFLLRKHLCLHAAKAHGLFSPARHFAIAESCAACHRFYASIGQVQQHLKQSPACLRRCVDLFPPLSKSQISELERPSKQANKKLRDGCWQGYQGNIPVKVPLIQGPFLPTAAERRGTVAEHDEEVLLADLRLPFVPEDRVVSWIEAYLSMKSTEGPRQATVRFWQRRPAEVLRSQPTVSPEFSLSKSFGRALMKALESSQNRTEKNTIVLVP